MFSFFKPVVITWSSCQCFENGACWIPGGQKRLFLEDRYLILFLLMLTTFFTWFPSQVGDIESETLKQ